QPRRPGKAGAASTRMVKSAQEQFSELQRQMSSLLGITPPSAPPSAQPTAGIPNPMPRVDEENGHANGGEEPTDEYERKKTEQEERIRQRLRDQVASGARDDEEIEIEVEESSNVGVLPLFTGPGAESMGDELQGMLGQMLPKRRKRRRV